MRSRCLPRLVGVGGLLALVTVTCAADVAADRPALPPPGEMARAKALIEAGELDAARRRLEPIVRDHPDWGRAILLLGVVELKENRFERARALLERAAALDPDELSGRLFLGWCLFYLGELEPAERSVRDFLERAPGHAEGWYALGRILFESARVGEARAALERSRDLAVSSKDRLVEGRARARLGELLAGNDDLPAARRELEAAVALLPESREAWFRLSRVLERSGLVAEAAAARARADLLEATEERDRWRD